MDWEGSMCVDGCIVVPARRVSGPSGCGNLDILQAFQKDATPAIIKPKLWMDGACLHQTLDVVFSSSSPLLGVSFRVLNPFPPTEDLIMPYYGGDGDPACC
jgi:hypothetical protein